MSIKQQGGVFGRNPTFNDVTIEGQLTFDGDIDINSDLKVNGNLDVVEGMTVDADTLVVDAINNRVGMGTATPSFELHLSRNGAGIFIESLNSSPPEVRMDSTIRSWTQYVDTSGNYVFRDRTGATTVLEFTTAGNLAVANGNGIDFSATAGTGTSELFDDYEEGTWTPTLTRLTAGDFSYTASGADEGTYTKIGRMVYAKFRINGTFTESTASGAYLITGLPFTSPTNNHLFSVFYTSGGTVLDAVPRALDTRIQLLFTPTSGFNYVGGGFYTAS